MTKISAHWLYLLAVVWLPKRDEPVEAAWPLGGAKLPLFLCVVWGTGDGRHAQGVTYRQSCQILSRPSFRPALVSRWKQTHVGKPRVEFSRGWGGWSSMLCSLTSDHQNHSLCLYLEVCIRRLFPLSLQLQAQVTLASLAWCQKWGECAKPCARRSVCFYSQNGGGTSIGLLT
jgi:hypothetical protein